MLCLRLPPGCPAISLAPLLVKIAAADGLLDIGLRIGRAGFHQLIVGADGGYFTVLHDHNAVGVCTARNALCDY